MNPAELIKKIITIPNWTTITLPNHLPVTPENILSILSKMDESQSITPENLRQLKSRIDSEFPNKGKQALQKIDLKMNYHNPLHHQDKYVVYYLRHALPHIFCATVYYKNLHQNKGLY